MNSKSRYIESFPCLLDFFTCSPSPRDHFEVIAAVYRVGSLYDGIFFFKVLDKSRLSPNAKTIDSEPDKWEWRNENGTHCEEPPSAFRPGIATEKDYYERILPALSRIEKSFS